MIQCFKRLYSFLFGFRKLFLAKGLDGLTGISDVAAQALAACQGDLYLDGLIWLSDVAAHSLAMHQGKLSLRGLTRLSEMVAQSLVVQALTAYEQKLSLNALTWLTDAAAQALAAHQGDLHLNGLTWLSDVAAQALAAHQGDLHLNGLTWLSDVAAQALAAHQGDLNLDGLTVLSDVVAEALSEHKGDSLTLYGLKWISNMGAMALLRREQAVNTWLNLDEIAFFRPASDCHQSCPMPHGLSSQEQVPAPTMARENPPSQMGPFIMNRDVRRDSQHPQAKDKETVLDVLVGLTNLLPSPYLSEADRELYDRFPREALKYLEKCAGDELEVLSGLELASGSCYANHDTGLYWDILRTMEKISPQCAFNHAYFNIFLRFVNDLDAIRFIFSRNDELAISCAVEELKSKKSLASQHLLLSFLEDHRPELAAAVAKDFLDDKHPTLRELANNVFNKSGHLVDENIRFPGNISSIKPFNLIKDIADIDSLTRIQSLETLVIEHPPTAVCIATSLFRKDLSEHFSEAGVLLEKLSEPAYERAAALRRSFGEGFPGYEYLIEQLRKRRKA